MTKIYDQYRAAFRQVESDIVLHDGKHIANVSFKHPRDGAGRLYVYIHYFGAGMVRGFAGGYGYDKRSAACANAVKHLSYGATDSYGNDWSKEHDLCERFKAALLSDNGKHWDAALRDAGFDVWKAV